MEPARKKIKTNEEEMKTTFSDLNDDCILEILKLLKLKDLCEMSLTCKRIQSLAGYQFHRLNLDSEWVTVTYSRTIEQQKTTIVFKCSRIKYVNCFSSHIRNVRVQNGIADGFSISYQKMLCRLEATATGFFVSAVIGGIR